MNSKTIIYSVIVIIVVAVLVFVTINNKGSSSAVDNSATTTSGTDANTSVNAGQSANSAQTSDVQVTIINQGTGTTAQAGDTVSMNYTGTLPDGTVFDSNTDPKFSHVQPFTFTLGAGQVIKGWDQGIVGMKVGEERKLVISPNYAYGVNGIPGIIPPNSALTFDVTLLSVKAGNPSPTSGVIGTSSTTGTGQ